MYGLIIVTRWCKNRTVQSSSCVHTRISTNNKQSKVIRIYLLFLITFQTLIHRVQMTVHKKEAVQLWLIMTTAHHDNWRVVVELMTSCLASRCFNPFTAVLFIVMM